MNNESITGTRGLKIYHIITLSVYGIALLACLVCNLAILHTLSWFFIVLCSIGIAFSVTNVPLLAAKYRLIFSALSATVFLYLLLFVCNRYTGGNWLFTYAYPIATYPVILVWLMVLIVEIKPLNWYYKSALLSLISGIITITVNPWVDAVVDNGVDRFANFFIYQFMPPAGVDNTLNGYIGIGFFLYFAIGMVLGVAAGAKKSPRKKNR